MAKLQVALVLLLVTMSVFSCHAQRQRARSGRLQRNRQFARQEAEEAVTPYPSADEIKPEIPFNEAVPAPADEPAVVEAEEVPEVPESAANEPIPDEVYGPPEVAVLYNTPDEVYGPPEVEANLLPADVALARQRQRARLTQSRRQAAYRQARLAKLRSAKPKRSA